MKLGFFFMMLIVLSSLCYVHTRVWQVLPLPIWGKAVVLSVMIAIFISFILVYTYLDKHCSMEAVSFFYHLGNTWLMVLLYLFMAFVFLDVARLIHLIPNAYFHNNYITATSIFLVISSLFVYGNIHYHNKERQSLQAKTSKTLSSSKKIVMISDLHLGYHNQRKTLSKWVDMINKENPDMVLIAGDVIDFSIKPLQEQKMWEEFQKIKVPIYACLGNHEYISNRQEAKEFYRLSNITLLCDSVAEENDLLIIGRDDRSNKNRKSLQELLINKDRSKYSILLDHQPYNLSEAEENKIDFQFSGHTHYGQLFPINLITKLVYEKAFGEYSKGQTQYYISSGLGIWGAKIRIGTRSEYVVLTIN